MILLYVTEIGPAKSGVFCCGVVNCIEVVAIIPASLYFMFISNEWKYYYILAIVISVISFPFVFYLPESPKYLYEKGRHFELREVLRRIAETNKVKMDDNFIFENSAMKGQEDERSSKFLKTQSNEIDLETDLVSNVETFSVCNYLKNPAVTINLIVCCITFMAANFNYYMINFYMKYAGGNIYINIILLTISENIAYNTGSFIQSKFGTRKTFFFSYLSSIAFCIPLIFWDDVEWVIMVSVFLSRFGVAASFTLIYYVNQEIFPILFVPFSLSMCNFFARAIAIVAPQIAEIPKPFPVFSFIVIGGLALVSILFMRKIKDDKTKEHNHN